MFPIWQRLEYVVLDPRVNYGYGEGQWCYQLSWEIYIRRRIELIEEEHSHGRSSKYK